MEKGYLSIILHAHLPFVRHPEYDEFLEEDWLYEAITETYIPLLLMMDGLLKDGVDFRLSIVLSPTLLAMLEDNLLRQRYGRYITKLIELSEKEIQRTKGDYKFEPLARFYNNRFKNILHYYQNICNCDLINAFKNIMRTGKLEIITCAGTHGFLPLLRKNYEAVRAQIEVGVREYRRHFAAEPKGIWLPECAYYEGVDEILAQYEIRYFFLDTHGILFSKPRPVYGIYAPIFTPSLVAVFGRDPETSHQVWSAKQGYPGDVYYREFYRDIGWDREFDYIKPYIQPTGHRKFTGIKYYRITGATQHKEPYIPSAALQRAETHSGNFMFNRERQIEYYAERFKRPPLIVAPYDAELFGHWWFEGIDFLNFFFRKAYYDQKVFKTITPSEYLREFPTHQLCTPSQSSWGDKGYFEVWLNGCNDWIYPHYHIAGDRMTAIARRFPSADGILKRALNQCAKELLLMQSSDWAFIMNTKTAVEYAVKRVKNHIHRFNKIYDQIISMNIDEEYLSEIEERDNIFPYIDYRIYI